MEPSLVEFLPSPPLKSFRIRVEMRQEASYNPFGTVGVFVAHSAQPGPESHRHVFGCAHFADLGPRAYAFEDKAGRPAGLLRLDLGLIDISPVRKYLSEFSQKSGISYVPPRLEKRPGPWKAFTLDVRPVSFVVRWNGEAARLEPGKVLPVWLANLRRHNPRLTGVRLEPPMGGAVGIYLYGSRVSVRCLSVEPLAED
jgi:hypothetical protein